MTNPFELQPQSLEARLQTRVRKVLSTPVSPENIQTFFETNLNELVEIVNVAVETYKKDHPKTPLVQAELEDEALRLLNLPDILGTLQAISDRVETMLRIKRLIQEETRVEDTVFVRPEENGGGIDIGTGAGMEEKKLIPRLLTLLYILENDLEYNLSPDEESESPVRIVRGAVTSEMMRREPYFRVDIDPLKRAVYICEEEGNATFIFDIDKLQVPLERLDTMNKAEFNALIIDQPGLGKRVVQDTKWREHILVALTESFSQSPVSTFRGIRQRSDFTPRHETSKKKEGWENANSLQKPLKASSGTIRTFAETFRNEHPKWFETQQPADGKAAEHYHPELVAILNDNFLIKSPARGEGWESSGTLSSILNASPTTIETFAHSFHNEHPKWFQNQRGARGATEHYHPDLAQIIRNHFSTELPHRKEGWESARTLSSALGGHYRAIAKFVESYRREHPEWFEKQRATRGPAAEYYHPELVKIIHEKFSGK